MVRMWSDCVTVAGVKERKKLEILCDLKEETTASLLGGFIMIHSDSCESLYDTFKSDVFASFQNCQTETQR